MILTTAAYVLHSLGYTEPVSGWLMFSFAILDIAWAGAIGGGSFFSLKVKG